MKISVSMWVLLVTTLVFSSAGAARANPTITFLVENDCPYSCEPENGEKHSGFIQDILYTIFDRNGYQATFVTVPFMRALLMFNSRSPGIDGMIGMKSHPLDQDLALFPEENIARYTHRFYALKGSPLIDSWHYTGVDSVAGLRIGCVQGWQYSDKEFSRYLHQGSEPYVQALYGEGLYKRNLKKLLTGRIDLWIANTYNVTYLLQAMRRDGNREAEKIVGVDDLPITSEVEVYPVFYNDETGKEYAEIYTEGLRALRESGELEVILSAYNIGDGLE